MLCRLTELTIHIALLSEQEMILVVGILLYMMEPEVHIPSIYGLDHSTEYYIKVFEYNGTNSETSYLTTDDAEGNPILDFSMTTLTYPTVQASNIVFSNLLGENMTVSWTNGDGNGRILIIREDSPVDIEPTNFGHMLQIPVELEIPITKLEQVIMCFIKVAAQV